jgi:O-antigen/teichoic acid export membrane protein
MLTKKSGGRFAVGEAIGSSFLIYAVGAVLVFLTQILLARLMGPAEYGMYYYAFSWLVVIALFSQFGFDQALLRFMPVYAHDKDWPSARGILNMGGRLVTANGLLLGCLMAVVVLALGGRLEESQRNAFLVAALCLPFRGLIYIRQATLRSFMYTIRSLLPDAVIVPLVLMALAASLLWTTSGPTAPMVMAATLIALMVSFLVGAYWQSRLIPHDLRMAKPSYHAGAWLRLAFMMLVINGAHMLLNNVDLLILGLYRSPEEVGIYGVSARVASMVTFILIASYPVFAPLIARQHALGQREALQQAIAHGMRPIAVAAVGLACALVIMGAVILGWFGEDFKRGQMVLNILLLGQTVNALCGPVALLLAFAGQETLVARVLVVAVAMSIGLNLLIIPIFGMEGAACVTAFAAVFWNLALYVLARRHLKIDSSGWFSVNKE